jgi:hypothetical protein
LLLLRNFAHPCSTTLLFPSAAGSRPFPAPGVVTLMLYLLPYFLPDLRLRGPDCPPTGLSSSFALPALHLMAASSSPGAPSDMPLLSVACLPSSVVFDTAGCSPLPFVPLFRCIPSVSNLSPLLLLSGCDNATEGSQSAQRPWLSPSSARMQEYRVRTRPTERVKLRHRRSKICPLRLLSATRCYLSCV